MSVFFDAFPYNADHVNFAAVKAASRRSIESLVRGWLPSGRREGDEWTSVNPTRGDKRAGSFKINLKTGLWSDFATGDAGGDMIDLHQYLYGSTPLDAAREVGKLLGIWPHSAQSDTPQGARSAPETEEKPKDPSVFPPRTPPDEDGKPPFIIAGEAGPPRGNDELRRHFYRAGTTVVRIKIMRSEGSRATNWYRVADGATTGWQSRKPEGFKAGPYVGARDPFGADHAGTTLWWPEGEKDVDTVSKLGEAAFCFGGTGDGLPKGCELYVSRDLVILADNDEAGRKHAERKAELAAPVAARVRVVHFPELPTKGDVTDWILLGHTRDDLLARVEATADWTAATATEPRPQDGTSRGELRVPSQEEKAEETASNEGPASGPKRSALPPGFSFSGRGLMYNDQDDLDKPAMLVAGTFDIEAETRDGDGSSWGVLLRWLDHDGREHRQALPRASLAGDGSEARRLLMDGGFYVAPSQKARGLFNSFLLQVKSPNRARATNRVGWHGNAFVLPDDCFGDKRDGLLLQTATAHEHSFRQSGTLQSWQENVARYAAGNSRLVLAISAAFAAPLIGPLNAEGGGIHFRGGLLLGRPRRCMLPAAPGAVAIRPAISILARHGERS